MKIRVEIDDTLMDEEILIRCRELNEDTLNLQKRLAEMVQSSLQLHVEKGGAEFFLKTEEIVFIEAAGSVVAVHTKDAIYESREKLYELENMLGFGFMRVSKSTIINLNAIRSIRKNIAGPSEVEFRGTAKKAYVSRNYINILMNKLEEKKIR